MIARLIHEQAKFVQAPAGLNTEALLWAIYKCERYVEHAKFPRFEPAYAPDGIYFKNSELVRREYAKWGNWACCSYSDFQIMYITAVELGYDGPPLALDRDVMALPWVVKYLNDRAFARGAKTVEEVADAYNSGTHRNHYKPLEYIAKCRKYYDRKLEELKSA